MSTTPPASRDRIAGVLTATACGDALGAPYEFGEPLPPDASVGMVGGGSFGWGIGEWTDDTSMAVVIAQAAATGVDLRSVEAHDAIVAGWLDWAASARDVGVQTREVLSTAKASRTGAAAAQAARQHHESTGRSGGNGSLMRTAPVALAYLRDEEGCAEAARSLSALTHFDPEAGDACVLWSLAIRHAILTGEMDAHIGLDHLPAQRRDLWLGRLTAAEGSVPSAFTKNGWVVEALQAAWCAIATTPVPPEDPDAGSHAAAHLQLALEAAVRGGRDTDTVAAIAGGLLGARWGASAIPLTWQRRLHGWPEWRYRDLIDVSLAIAGKSVTIDRTGYAHLRDHTQHPHHPNIIMGSAPGAVLAPERVTAVVSLCPTKPEERPPGVTEPLNQVHVWLLDSSRPEDNPNLNFVLDQTTLIVDELLAEGHTVYLHCAAGQSRTPTVGALVGARHAEITPAEALVDVLEALPDPSPNPYFRQVLNNWRSPSAPTAGAQDA